MGQSPLSVLKSYPKASPGVGPFYSSLIAEYLATATFQAALIGKGDLAFPQLETFCRTYVKATPRLTLLADLLFQADMGLSVNIIFIES